MEEEEIKEKELEEEDFGTRMGQRTRWRKGGRRRRGCGGDVEIKDLEKSQRKMTRRGRGG